MWDSLFNGDCGKREGNGKPLDRGFLPCGKAPVCAGRVVWRMGLGKGVIVALVPLVHPAGKQKG